jgi:cob(I)alamin adenosyltransferase
MNGEEPMSPYDTHDGDEGYTGLLGRDRVPKYDRRVEALGAIDESNAALGLARAQVRSPETARVLLQLQRDLYTLMAEIASTPENAENYRAIDAARVEWLETTIHEFDQRINMPFEFIIPGDSLPGATLDLARTVIRRAERRVVELTHAGDLQNMNLVRYLNRASNLCYALELFENIQAGQNRPTLAKDSM